MRAFITQREQIQDPFKNWEKFIISTLGIRTVSCIAKHTHQSSSPSPHQSLHKLFSEQCNLLWEKVIWKEILTFKYYQFKRHRQQPSGAGSFFFSIVTYSTSIKCQRISNKKEYTVLTKSIQFKIVLLWNCSKWYISPGKLPFLFCNALNANHSHLVIAIVL